MLLSGVVLGSFYYGYVALQIPGGWLAVKVGGTRLFGLAVLIASVLTILTPVAARASVGLLVVVRVAEGLVLVSISVALKGLLCNTFFTRDSFQSFMQFVSGTSKTPMLSTCVCFGKKELDH